MSAQDARGLTDENAIFVLMHPIGTTDTGAAVVKLSHPFQVDVQADLAHSRDWVQFLAATLANGSLPVADEIEHRDRMIRMIAEVLNVGVDEVRL
jgi:hypothetical protein